jgi:hypothetical protein
METSIESLEQIGKQSFEHCFQNGLFFFPKVLSCPINGQMILSQYEGDFNQFVNLCVIAARSGPLEFIAHTGDTYYFNAEADPLMVQRMVDGETSASEQFEEGNPNSSEALIILVIDAQGHFEQRVLPYRRDGKKLRWSEAVVVPEGLQPTGRYAEVMAATIKASYASLDENTGG